MGSSNGPNVRFSFTCNRWVFYSCPWQKQQYRKSRQCLCWSSPALTAPHLQWPAVISPPAASSKVHFLKRYPCPALNHTPVYWEATSASLSVTESRNSPACRTRAPTPLLLFPPCLLWKITSMLCTVCYRRSFFV